MLIFPVLDKNNLKGINMTRAINNLTKKSPIAKETQGIPVP